MSEHCEKGTEDIVRHTKASCQGLRKMRPIYPFEDVISHQGRLTAPVVLLLWGTGISALAGCALGWRQVGLQKVTQLKCKGSRHQYPSTFEESY